MSTVSTIGDSYSYYQYQPTTIPIPSTYNNNFIYTNTTPAPQLVEIKVASVKAGYLGQIIMRNEIRWQSKAFETEGEARRAADAHLVKALEK